MFATYCSGLSFSTTSFFLGNVFGACLYGALTVQLYQYYMSFPKDRKLFKAVIYIVYVTETIFTVLVMYTFTASLYDSESGIVHLAMIDPIKDLGPLFTSTGVPGLCKFQSLASLILAVCGGAVNLLTQSMYAYRIRIITNLRCFSWVIILVIVLNLLSIVAMCTLRSSASFTIWVSIALIVDTAITSTLVWFLKKDEIYCKRFQRKITRLIYLIIGTGFLTAAANLCWLILTFAYFKYTVGLVIVIPKLYANSMMVLVNSRIPSARSETTTLDVITIQLGSFHVTSQAVADAEYEPQGASVGLKARSVGLSAEDTRANNHDLGSSTV